MGRDNTKGKIQRTILHHLSWRGMAASLAMAALPATAAEPDSLAIDTMSYDLGDVTVTAQRKLVKNDIDKLTYDVANDETARTKRSSQTQAPKKTPRAHSISSTSSCRTTPTWQA